MGHWANRRGADGKNRSYCRIWAVGALTLFCGSAVDSADDRGQAALSKRTQPTLREERIVEGWTVRVDARLLGKGGSAADRALGERSLQFLGGKLRDIVAVVPKERVEQLRKIPIVLDRECGDLQSMQYHPSREWLVGHGYPPQLARCVHIPQADAFPTPRNIREQPWSVLHELAHAYHDQVLGFDHPKIREAYRKYRASGRGDAALLFNGRRVKHYGLTDNKEFFAEMTEAYFGSNDFFPFNNAELLTDEPETHALLKEIWGPVP